MRKSKSLLLTILTIFMCVPFVAVKALNVSTLSASETEDGKISISGTTEAGVYAVAIEIYNEDGSELVAMKTTSVDDSNKYSDSITLAAKTYVVKVADYDGGNYVKATVKPGETATTTESENKSSSAEATPNTLDNIMVSIVLACISLAGVVGAILYIKKNAKN